MPASHLRGLCCMQGIARNWERAGYPETGELASKYLQASRCLSLSERCFRQFSTSVTPAFWVAMSPKQTALQHKAHSTPLGRLLQSRLPCIHLASIHVCPLQVPKQEEASPYLTGAVTVAVLGTIAYRRPKALAVFAGMVALATAPYLGFMVVTINRFGRVSWGGGGSAAAAAAAVLCCRCCAAAAAAAAAATAAACSAHALLWLSLHAFVWAPLLQTPSPTCSSLPPLVHTTVCKQAGEHGGDHGCVWQHQL